MPFYCHTPLFIVISTSTGGVLVISKKYYQRNNNIKAKEVRLVGEGTNKVIPLTEALKRAYAAELDLVEISPNAKPPVVKIIDFKKFLFDEKKKAKIPSRSKTRLKEFRIGPGTGQGDIDTRIRRAKKFLEEGHQVKLTAKFKGRERRHPEVGKEKLEKMVAALQESSEVSKDFEKKGQFLSVTLAPKRSS